MNWQPKDHVRLVFHATFKRFSREEVQSIKGLLSELGDYDVEYAFVQLSEQHPYILFDKKQNGAFDYETKRTKGIYAPERGRYLELGNREVLLSLTGPREVKRPEDGTPPSAAPEFAPGFHFYRHDLPHQASLHVRLSLMAHVSAGIRTCDDSVFEPDRECAWPPLAHGSVEPGGHVGSHRNDEMVPVSTTSDFLLADARAALRRRLTESCRTELSRAFAAWLLREPETDAEFASLVSEAATREGAQQDFQTVAILGFGADAGILGAAQIEVLKKGLRRQAGREVVIDGLPVAFCSDAVGILGIVLGTKAVADADITDRVVKWASKFLKNSYDTERAEDWQRSLFAAADQQFGSSLNLSFPKSAATADVRTALVARGLIEAGGDNQAGGR